MAKRKYYRIGKKKFKKSHIKTITLFLYIIVSIYIFPFNDISVEGNEAEVIVDSVREGDTPVPQGTDYTGIPYMSKTMEVSAYSELDSCHYPTREGCLTASGKIAEVGMVATNLYDFGTILLIDGKEYTVEDRISKRYNNRIDIFQGYGKRAYYAAIDFGVKNLEVKQLN